MSQFDRGGIKWKAFYGEWIHASTIVELEQIALGDFVHAAWLELFLYWSFLSSTTPHTA